MANTISVAEGAVGQATGQDILKYPEITSCITLTAVFADGKRYGGHAVLFKSEQQLSLQQICDKILENKGTSTRLMIIGEIQVWDSQWDYIPQAKDLVIKGKKITKVSEIGPAMGFTTNDNWDTNVCPDNKLSYDIYFQYAGNTRQVVVKDAKETCPAFNNKTW